MHHELSIDEFTKAVCTNNSRVVGISNIKKGYQMIALGVF
jgi:hypothetical protein